MKIIFIFKEEVWKKNPNAQLAELGPVKTSQVGSRHGSLQTQLQLWQQRPKAGKSAAWAEKPNERQWRYKVCVMLLIFGLGAASVKETVTEK